MDPIEISSSSADSEFGTDDDEPEIVDPPATSAISSWRPLSSASTSSTSTTNDKIQGHGEWSRKVPYGASTGNRRPFLSDHQLRIKDPLGSSKGAGFGSSAFVAGQSCNLSQTEEEKHYMKPPERRNLPSSFYGSAARPALNGLRPVEPMSQINNYGGPRYPAVMSVSNGKSLANNDAYMLDESGTRILPSSFVHGLGNQSGRYPSPNDFMMSSSLRGEQGDEVPDETGTYQEAVQDIIQPKEEQELPVGLLSVPLLRHQKIALAWMLRKESRSNCVGGILADDQGLGKTISMIALIQMQRHLEELKSKMEEKSNHKAETLTLDDDDDSGSINLDTVNKTEGSVGALDCKKPTSVQKTSYKQRPQAGTLVVCPATILRQWARELDDKVDPQAKIKSLVYHGSDRTKDPLELAQYDVVLTTYAIVSKEVPKQPLDDEDDGEPKAGDKYGLSSDFSQNKKRKNSFSTSKGNKGKKGVASCSFGGNDNTLSKVRWLRVVLDEAQTIKNHRTQAARACCGLRAKKRWCLSGTPIQNTIDELFSYFKFLKYDPYHSYKAFIEAIKAPISRDSEYGYRKLQVILRNVMLRRTKDTRINGKPIIKLPSKHINLESVEFSREEREFYVKLEADSRSQFKAYAAAGTVSQNYANILLMLLRLRQACDHPLLVCGFSSGASNVTASIKILKQLPKDKVVELLHCLEDSSICKLCSDPPEDAVVATCGHIFCDQCLLDYLVGDDHTCPVRRCKVQLGKDVVFSKAALQSCLSNDSKNRFLNSEGNGQSSTMFGDVNSSKIKAAIKILKSFQNPSSDVCIDLDGSSAPGDQAEADVAVSDVNVRTETLVPSASQGTTKAIVFSQWTRMLDLFQRAMEQSGITFRRLDGSMSLAARDKAVKEFNTDSEVVVMLMSLKAGNLGLNMVAACHVILLDLWWNPTTEDQAIDRAHRIGQTRAVTVSRLTVKGTVEDRILALQEEKRKMVASAFGEENAGGNSTRLTLEDLRYLFGGVNRT